VNKRARAESLMSHGASLSGSLKPSIRGNQRMISFIQDAKTEA
jgi:hypothetical protein